MAPRTLSKNERYLSMTEDDKTSAGSSAEDLASLVPKRRSNSPLALIVLGVIAAVGVGAWFFTVGGASESKESEPASNGPSQPAQAPEDHAPVNAAPPPPPPPVAEAEAASATTEEPNRQPTAAKKRAASGGNECADPCNGKPNPAFSGALRRRGQLARSCYDAALRQDSTLSGKLLVRVRVAPSGTVCDATIAQDQIGSAVINTCILSKFRSAGFPAPSGGCVDGQVPLNFVSKP